MKRLFFVFFFAQVMFAGSSSNGVERTILQFRDAAPSAPGSTFDFNHTKMLALGAPNNIYTAADAATLDTDAYAHFFTLTGIDFGAAVFDPAYGALRLGSIALLAPFFIGEDEEYNVLYDSDKNAQGQKWTIRNNSWIVQFISSGTFPGGTNQGYTYQVGDILSYGYTDHLRVGKNWQNHSHREHFTVFTTRPGNQPFNIFGVREIHAGLRYIDENGRIGYGSDNVYKEVLSPTNTRQITHHVITFSEADQQSLIDQ